MNLIFVLLLLFVVNCNKLKKYENVKKMSVGIKFRPEECEQRVESGDSIEVHYTGMLAATGEKFDSSLDRGQPFQFTVGTGSVIKGWDEGLLNACVGEKRRLVIPPEKGYGDRGAGEKIPGGSVLVFDVELISIQ